jgi:hypothetical protein
VTQLDKSDLPYEQTAKGDWSGYQWAFDAHGVLGEKGLYPSTPEILHEAFRRVRQAGPAGAVAAAQAMRINPDGSLD